MTEFSLTTRDLSKKFGAFQANSAISLAIRAGDRHALIGPNGAGKTTFINLLTGVIAPSGGSIVLNGQDITRRPPHARVKLGLVRTFQINQLFADLTPLEAVALAISERRRGGAAWWRRMGTDSAVVDEAAELLARMRLGEGMTEPTRALPYGRQRLLEIALALACQPRVLLLDEPAAGVPEGERREILDIIAALPRSVTIVLIEHDMSLVFAFADRISVLVQGALFAEGSVAEIAADPGVRAVYLGEDAHV